MTSTQKETALGIGLGLVGAGIGLLGLAVWWRIQTGDSMGFFLKEVFWNGGLYQDSIVTVSVLVDVLLFFGLIRVKREAVARGVLAVVLASVPLVIYLQMVNFQTP